MSKKPKEQPEQPDKAQLEPVRIDLVEEREVIWWPDKLSEEIRNDWPLSARKDVGFELGRVQQGLEPSSFRKIHRSERVRVKLRFKMKTNHSSG
jgi:hypothetical protein